MGQGRYPQFILHMGGDLHRIMAGAAPCAVGDAHEIGTGLAEPVHCRHDGFKGHSLFRREYLKG